jgi:hypothetical protein
LTVKTAPVMKAVRVRQGEVRIEDEVFEITTIRTVEYVQADELANLGATCSN